MEAELLFFCEKQGSAEYEQLAAQFGQPGDVAADFFAEADAKSASRFAYTRLKIAYLLLTVVVVAALSAVAVSAANYAETQQLVSGAQVAETYIHPDGKECTTFWVRTHYRGADVYWEYHSCIGCYLNLSTRPETADGTEPYATDIYLNHDGTMIHWNYSDDNFYWIRVYDEK